MSDFEDGVKKIVGAVKDITELNVQTFTGTIKQNLRGKPLSEIMADSVPDGTLEVVALTTMKLDGDVDQFISNSATVTDEHREAHFAAVEAGQASRKATLEFFANSIKAAIETLT